MREREREREILWLLRNSEPAFLRLWILCLRIDNTLLPEMFNRLLSPPLLHQGVFRFGPFDIGRVWYFGIDKTSILRAPTPQAPGGTFATESRYQSIRYRNQYLRCTVQPGIEAELLHSPNRRAYGCLALSAKMRDTIRDYMT